MSEQLQKAREALQRYFGYREFRPLQAEVIQCIYDGKDVLLLMPTGGGKSICYQLPALTLEGCCVVVSPLISLMKDQVEGLVANGVKAAFLNSSLSYEEQQAVENDLYNGKLDLLYTSPEKMCSQEFFTLLKAAKISLFAIDEAHCISSWGHDFRPEYRKLTFLKQSFPDVPVIAVTATADKLTRKDIARQLKLHRPEVFVASFDRPNIFLEARPGRKKFEQIRDFIRRRPGQPGIVYCLAKKSCESLAAKLQEAGISADSYHAGHDSLRRSSVQEDFIADRTQVICATIAFGMGIDKSNVRWVIHYNLPKNIESYYQEIGRCGRDGAAAHALLFHSFSDVMTLRNFITSEPSENSQVYQTKLDRMYEYATAAICRRKMLLNYFNEAVDKDCGHCDVCKNPPEYFDGTVTAQKALSAVARCKEQIGTGMLVDILRGSKGYHLVNAGYDKIKTWGAGREHNQEAWFQYINQLILQGLLEVAYEDHNKLRLTPAAREVLFNGKKVKLVKAEILKKRQEAKPEVKPKRERVRDDLFLHLRQLRLEIARERGVPPYIIFSDASLEEMAAMRPTTEADFAQISGVGEKKLEEFGRTFIKAIEEYLIEEESKK
ncbi:MAG: DNA helicase RecQ [Saprospiraceae bacterium]